MQTYVLDNKVMGENEIISVLAGGCYNIDKLF